jgi:tyrosine-protein phosphatase SIW14
MYWRITERDRSASSTAVDHSTVQQLPMLVPPGHFLRAETGVFSSSFFETESYDFVQALGIRTVACLSPRQMPTSLQKFFKTQGSEVHHLGCGHWKPRAIQKNDSFVPISDELAKKALELVLDKRKHPVMVICKTGVHQSATLIACLRRVLHWGMT